MVFRACDSDRDTRWTSNRHPAVSHSCVTPCTRAANVKPVNADQLTLQRETQVLTVMAWNMKQQAAAWRSLVEISGREGVSVAMLQEARNPGQLPAGWVSNPPADENDRDERWRLTVPRYYRADNGDLKETKRWFASAIVATGQLELAPRTPSPLHEVADGELACSHPGQFAISDLALADGSRLTLISLYGIWDRMHDSRQIYVEATLHRAISDLTPVLQERAADFVLIAGDMNLYSYSDGSVWGDRAMTVLDRFKAYGIEICGPFRRDGEPRLERCPCPDLECRHVNTYLHQSKPENNPHQLDYFLASAPLRQRLVDSWADADPSWHTK